MYFLVQGIGVLDLGDPMLVGAGKVAWGREGSANFVETPLGTSTFCEKVILHSRSGKSKRLS